MSIKKFVESYRFEHDSGGPYAPNEREQEMLEDALNCYQAQITKCRLASELAEIHPDDRHTENFLLAVGRAGLQLTDRGADVTINFKTGDRVRHVSRDEDGTVTVLENGDVKVEFDKPTPRGNPSVGVYDATWFRIYPNGLVPLTNTGSMT